MIYSKLDNYTVMLYNASFKTALEKLSMYDEGMDMLLSEGLKECLHMIDKQYLININGIRFSLYIDDMDYLMDSCGGEVLPFSEMELDKIRIEMSGSGLDWLRSRSGVSFFDPDSDLHSENFWSPTLFKVTRCDFAFDFVNCFECFLDEFIAWIRNLEDGGYLHDKSARLRSSFRCGVSYKYHWGNTIRCFYIGSSSSDHYLRIYDKLLETAKKQKGLLNDLEVIPAIFNEHESEAVHSWFRIELQTRDDVAASLLFQPDAIIKILEDRQQTAITWTRDATDYSYVLRYIFDKYMILGEDYKPCPILESIYNWDSLPALVPYNSSYVEFGERIIKKAENYLFGTMFNTIVAYCAIYGLDGFAERIKARLHEIQINEEPKLKIKKRAMMQKVAAFMLDANIPFIETALEDCKGFYKFKH